MQKVPSVSGRYPDFPKSNEEISGGIATRMDRSVAIIACGGGGADKEKEKKDGLVGSVA